ncbi:VaFE repeat-containing surface-anchored protein [Lactococcus garvieae]|uniref:VaFE repeat-containing surface-anchored protein n=1 Tax=Lactococcus garvieae TaxID=1363 RepID=UPI00254B4102|nr:VaFE repeat-containing surface-anchored protein [Lactococcus garvieae]
MSKFKKKKLQKALTEEKQTRFRLRKSGKHFVTTAMLLLTVGGTVAGLAQADVINLSPFSSPSRSITLPDNGPVNYKFSGTGKVKWSNGHDASANFMEVNGATTFCLEPFVDVFNGAYATKAGQSEAVYKLWNDMTEYQRNLINNITYIGEVNNAGADPNLNLATQFALWLVEAGQNEVAGLLPKVSELDTSKLNNVVGGHKITGLESTGADISEVVKYATTILKQAVQSSKNPDFNPNPLTVLAGSSATATDKAGVLAGGAGGYGLAFDKIQASEGLTAKREGNSLVVSATPSAIGKDGTIKVRNNSADFVPHYIYGTINPDGKVGQTLFATTDPALLKGQLEVKTIGLGEVTLQKTSTNNAFANKKMAGAEFTLYTSGGKPVKWTDGHAGYPITSTAGTKANNTNVVLKMGEDAKLGVKNLDYTKSYYFMETKAPAGFALNAVKIPVTFDENSKFDGTTKNYQDDVATQDIPTGSTTLTKVDADTDSSETQGEATLKGVTYGLFHADGKAVEWSEGLTDKTAGSTENLPITPTFGTKADDKKVELTIDDSNKVGVQNLPLKENGKSFYWQELRTSSGYSQSSKKIPVVFDDKSEVDVATNDFADKDKASNKVNVFNFMFNKSQEVNGSLTGLNGAEFTLTPKEGTKGNPIKAISGTGVDANGFTVNGLTVFDGKADEEAGNPSKDGVAIGDYTLSETKTPNGLKPINDVDVSIEDEVDDKGNPLSYTATFTDTVTGQVIDRIKVDASSLVDNNLMFKVNLGIFTDKMQAQPKITTTATDKADGDKTLGVGHAQVTDLAKISDLLPNTEYTLTGKVVYKGTGEAVMDKDGKPVTAMKKFTTDKEGNAEVQLDFPLIDNSQDENKEYTVTELVSDKEGNTVVEENNFKENPSQTVKVADADGHTEVQTKELEVGKNSITDKFYYKDLVEGTEYTVKIKQTYDHNLKKVIDVDGELTFTAKGSSGTVDVPVKIDTKKYAGHKITLYEDAWVGKETEKNRPIIHHHDKNDESETFTVKPKTPTPKADTPNNPVSKKLADTGAALGQHIWGLLIAFLALISGTTAFIIQKRKKNEE